MKNVIANTKTTASNIYNTGKMEFISRGDALTMVEFYIEAMAQTNKMLRVFEGLNEKDLTDREKQILEILQS